MPTLERFAAARPVLFVVGLAVLQPLVALPFVVAVRLADLDAVALRLIIPAVQSAIIFLIIWWLGWQRRAGLTGRIRNLGLYWYPFAIAFAPVLIRGTIEISPGWIVFYGAALIFTGLSEEGFARGIAIPALLGLGKWAAVFLAAAIFSAGHITNVFFEDFDLLGWIDKFTATFCFAVLYAAVFLRTGNLWPLVALHALHDYAYLTSGAAGPFLTEPIGVGAHVALSVLNAAYGVYLLIGFDVAEADWTR